MVIFTMVVPLVGTLPVSYDFFSRAKLLNTIPGMILLCVNGLGFAFLILYGGFQNLSWSYAEAASIDGAGPFRTFFQVMLPLMRPALVSIAVVTAISFWNDYTTPAVYYSDHPTLSYGINTLINEVKRSSSGGFRKQLSADVCLYHHCDCSDRYLFCLFSENDYEKYGRGRLERMKTPVLLPAPKSVFFSGCFTDVSSGIRLPEGIYPSHPNRPHLAAFFAVTDKSFRRNFHGRSVKKVISWMSARRKFP